MSTRWEVKENNTKREDLIILMREFDYLNIAMAEEREKIADRKIGKVILEIWRGGNECAPRFTPLKISRVLVIIYNAPLKVIPFVSTVILRVEAGIHIAVDVDLPLEDLEV